MQKVQLATTIFLALIIMLSNNSCKKDDNTPSGENKNYVLTEHLIESELPCFVNIMFEVTDSDGKGVPNLVTSDFVVEEDGQAVSPTESAMTVKNKDGIAYSVKTVLMLDNSTSVGSNLNEIKSSAINLVNSIVNQQEIAVYVFSEEAVLLQDFTSDVATLTSAINSISLGYATTNLYGSIITGVSRWDDFYSTQAIEQGFLIVITDGSDTQGSSTLQSALEEIGDKKVYTVGLGNEQDENALKQLGTAGYYSLENFSELSDQFKEIQDEIISYANSFYYLYYMSPKRGDNVHSLKLSVKNNVSFSASANIIGEFSSNGFYSVQQGVVVNNGISELELFQAGTTYLSALTYFSINNPSYGWQTSDNTIVAVTPGTNDNSNATITAIGNIGESATITVTDLSNSLSTTVEVTIIESPYGSFIDSRDNTTYKTIQIGSQIWMADNLDFETESGSWEYENSSINGSNYGRLYNWETAQQACPDGWHLPTNMEWITLITHLGGAGLAGGKLKETGTAHWKIPNSYATNESYFSAIPGGLRTPAEDFLNMGEKAYFWTSSSDDNTNAFFRKLDYDRASIAYGPKGKSSALSIRCVKD
jgi:uncharacterized protein (TIGR02145 family)